MEATVDDNVVEGHIRTVNAIYLGDPVDFNQCISSKVRQYIYIY